MNSREAELQESPSRRYGPLAAPLLFLALLLAALTVVRIALVGWQLERVQEVDGFGPVLINGLRMDLVALCHLLLPAVLFTLVLSGDNGIGRVWRAALRVYLVAWFLYFLFLEAATPGFIHEYDSRPNRLFFEYFSHPDEVVSMLLTGYKLQLALVTVASLATLWFGWKAFGRVLSSYRPTGPVRRILLGLLTLPLLFLGARSSVGHRPANPSTVSFSNDHLVNDLCLSSGYSVLYALYRLKDEADAGEVYGHLASDDELIDEVKARMFTVDGDAFVDPETPTLHWQEATQQRERPLNLVIILEESLGARYVGALGGQPVTSFLDSLRDEGWWFNRLYSTGTRSARGLEAVVAGFLPTPARSVLKLGKSQRGFFTLASFLKAKGFKTQFVYGGLADFDNMRSFFSGNGFDEIVDEADFDDPVFRGSWGVCDEDIFAKAHETFLANGDAPFFSLVFSVTNHSPFEFPEGRIELFDEPQATVSNAVRYADHALRGFFEKARQAPYWDNTLFLVVADHDSRVFGAELVPVERFHIPGVILGPGVEPRVDERIVSHVDLAPTLLSLMGVSGEHPMVGFDLTRLPDDHPGRAIMQYGQNQAFMNGNDVVVLQPHLEPRQFLYTGGELQPVDTDPSLAKCALAHALLPSWLYKKQLYRTRAAAE
ncbi:MAG: phosphoglycerol transferase MdoB-like AlkP superfamily enzyme [Chlamydiales bacterium]|jgi:phosphoglycerol transferase MdoB-like AlkP superfamily enzyme